MGKFGLAHHPDIAILKIRIDGRGVVTRGRFTQYAILDAFRKLHRRVYSQRWICQFMLSHKLPDLAPRLLDQRAWRPLEQYTTFIDDRQIVTTVADVLDDVRRQDHSGAE